MSSFRFSFLILFSLFFLLSLTSAFPFGPSFSFPSFPRSPFDSIFSPHRYRPSSSSLLQCRSLCNNAERIKEYNRLKHSTYQSNYILDNNNISNNNNNKVLQIRFDIKNNGQGLESYHHQVSNRFIPHHQPSMIDLLKRNNQQNTLMKNILDVSIQRPLSPLFTPTDTDKLSRCGCDRNNNNNNNNNNDIDELKASFHIPDNSNNEKITTELIKEENGEIRYYIRIPMKNNQEINHNNNIININNDSNLNINDNNNNNNNEQRMIEEQLKREKVSMDEANKERKTVENEKIPEKQKKEGGQNQYHQKKYYQKNNNNNNGNNHHHNNNNNNRNKRLVKERTSSDESLIDQLMKKEKDNFVIRDASPEQIEYKKRLIVDHHNDDEEQDIVHLD